MAQTNQQAKLCPRCANSIALDAVQCPYCKAELDSAVPPQWSERSSQAEVASQDQSASKTSVISKIMVSVIAVALVAGGVFMFLLWQSSHDLLTGVADSTVDNREKDQIIQTLEAELAKLREGNQSNSSQLDELKAKLIERQMDLAAMQRKLADANREIDRLTSGRVVSAPRPQARGAQPLPPPEPPAPVPARRAAEPGVYQTLRATTVYEEPVGSARVLTRIAKGTRVTVVRSAGDWLEVRSKHGNPPGFIRADDAMFIARIN